jgi:hypothetical protein
MRAENVPLLAVPFVTFVLAMAISAQIRHARLEMDPAALIRVNTSGAIDGSVGPFDYVEVFAEVPPPLSILAFATVADVVAFDQRLRTSRISSAPGCAFLNSSCVTQTPLTRAVDCFVASPVSAYFDQFNPAASPRVDRNFYALSLVNLSPKQRVVRDNVLGGVVWRGNVVERASAMRFYIPLHRASPCVNITKQAVINFALSAGIPNVTFRHMSTVRSYAHQS